MISIVTPNYNGARWLGDCLASVASQTLAQDEIEMILIDDGSCDDSRTIAEEYGSAIPGLKTVWLEHTGKPGQLRNFGIQKTIGEYILFLDSDDFLGNEALERLNEFTQNTQSDITAFELDGLNRNVPRSMLRKTIVDADIVASGIYKTLGTWKMCKRQFLVQNAISFDPAQNRGEDALFFAEAMLRATSISILSGYPFYTVRGREDGSSITQTSWNTAERTRFAQRLAKIITEYATNDEIANHFMIRVFNTEALGVITGTGTDGKDLDDLKRVLSPYWNDAVCRLIYSDEVRDTLKTFFETEEA